MMKDYAQIRQEVEKTLQELSLWKGEPQALYLPAVYALGQGGKRIRPVLALMACQLFGKDCAQALMPAVGLEVFHNFTLLHDDVMDKGPMKTMIGQEIIFTVLKRITVLPASLRSRFL